MLLHKSEIQSEYVMCCNHNNIEEISFVELNKSSQNIVECCQETIQKTFMYVFRSAPVQQFINYLLFITQWVIIYYVSMTRHNSTGLGQLKINLYLFRMTQNTAFHSLQCLELVRNAGSSATGIFDNKKGSSKLLTSRVK